MLVQSESRQHVWAGNGSSLHSALRSAMRTKLPLGVSRQSSVPGPLRTLKRLGAIACF